MANSCCPRCGEEKEKHWHLVCKKCWNKVPKQLQTKLWTEYKKAPGSDEHMAAASACYRALIEKDD